MSLWVYMSVIQTTLSLIKRLIASYIQFEFRDSKNNHEWWHESLELTFSIRVMKVPLMYARSG